MNAVAEKVCEPNQERMLQQENDRLKIHLAGLLSRDKEYQAKIDKQQHELAYLRFVKDIMFCLDKDQIESALLSSMSLADYTLQLFKIYQQRKSDEGKAT